MSASGTGETTVSSRITAFRLASHGDEVYGSDGRYLGEIKNGNRLITNTGKKGWTKFSFGPVQGGSYARYVNYVGYVMYVGYEDFPSPDNF